MNNKRLASPAKMRIPQPAHPDMRTAAAVAPSKISRRVRNILASPSYRLAEQDQAFFERDEVRGLRLHAEYLKPELLLREHGIRDTIVVYGSTRIPEPATAARNVKALQQVLQANPGDGNVVRKLAVAERILAKSHYYEVAREFGRLAAVKKELDQEYKAQVGLKTQSSKDVAPAKISSNLRT
jgi:hypothetical protein